ncbi:hypothetical protein ACHAWU_006616 [Discostella pseudostelligera]|uniref:Uncharacterized protein n=1 Tax=Discostella pseudostelligera TaxID=259834 RepID=A0ABD3M7Y9_9STRA
MNPSTRKKCHMYGGALLAFLVCALNFTILSNLTMSEDRYDNNIMVNNTPTTEAVSGSGSRDAKSGAVESVSTWSTTCQHLMAHQNGVWHHAFSDNISSSIANDPSILYLFFPEEMKWLHGDKRTSNNTSFGTCTRSNKYEMYNSLLGHQCGCGVASFQPSHSVWFYNTSSISSNVATNTVTIDSSSPKSHDYFQTSSTLRLARRIANANATICFVGDSVDYQIYMAMHNNLRRMDQLHQQYSPDDVQDGGLVLVVTREIPVVHATFEAGNDRDWFMQGRRPPIDEGHAFLYAERPPPGGFGNRSMHSILETKAIFKDRKFARIRYFMSYGWSPWNVDFMEDCNIIVQNFGLHYSSDGNHTNKVTGHSLFDDMLAAITYLSNFTASARRRIAVWRSALPQHFATSDGHYHGAWLNLEKEHTCSPIDKDATLKEQEYNNEYDAAFSKLCRADDQKSECSQYRHRCTVNPIADVEYQTIYNFWRANNCTHRIDNECLRLSKLHGQVTGTIYRWNIFNIFDVEWWHTDNMDLPYLSSEVCKVIVTNVIPAEFFNGNNVNIVRKCCGFNFFVNAPDDDDDSPASTGTTGVAI